MDLHQVCQETKVRSECRDESHLHGAFSCKTAATEDWAGQEGGEKSPRVTRVPCWSESYHREERTLLSLALGMIKCVPCWILWLFGLQPHAQPQLPECVLFAGKAVLRGCNKDLYKFPGYSRLNTL